MAIWKEDKSPTLSHWIVKLWYLDEFNGKQIRITDYAKRYNMPREYEVELKKGLNILERKYFKNKIKAIMHAKKIMRTLK